MLETVAPVRGVHRVPPTGAQCPDDQAAETVHGPPTDDRARAVHHHEVFSGGRPQDVGLVDRPVGAERGGLSDRRRGPCHGDRRRARRRKQRDGGEGPRAAPTGSAAPEPIPLEPGRFSLHPHPPPIWVPEPKP